MNEFERMSRLANHLKTKYPKGTRIMLIEMGDDPRPIPPHSLHDALPIWTVSEN